MGSQRTWEEEQKSLGRDKEGNGSFRVMLRSPLVSLCNVFALCCLLWKTALTGPPTGGKKRKTLISVPEEWDNHLLLLVKLRGSCSLGINRKGFWLLFSIIKM